jgi:hypothetical protein
LAEDDNESRLEERWRRYKFLDGLYRFYIKQIFTFHTLYFTLAGGVVIYVLNNSKNGIILGFGLVIPIVVSLGAVCIFYRALSEASELNDAIRDSAKDLNILSTHAQILVRAVCTFLFLHGVIIIGLVAIAILILKGMLPTLCKTG